MPLKLLNFSVPLCEGWLWLFLIRCSKLQKSFRKCQSPAQIWGVKQKNHSFLTNWINWTLSSHYLLWLLGSLKNQSLPWFHLASLEFLHCLIPPHYACCCPRHNSRRRSLSMLVLCHSDTHYLNRHMVGCGRHEISIAVAWEIEVIYREQK